MESIETHKDPESLKDEISRISEEQIKRGILTEEDLRKWRDYPRNILPKLLILNEKRANIIDSLKKVMSSIGDIQFDEIKKYNPHNAIKFFKRKYYEIIKAKPDAKKILDDEDITPSDE